MKALFQLVVLTAFLWSPCLAAQTVAATCRDARRDATPVERPPARPMLKDTLTVLLTRAHPNARPAALDALWASDSTVVEWSLAGLITLSHWSGPPILLGAAVQEYQRRSGRPGPILALMANYGLRDRRTSALRAITGPLTPVQEEMVFRYACDAALYLESLSGDSALRVTGGYDNHDLPELESARFVISTASRLIAGPRRASMAKLEARVAPR